MSTTNVVNTTYGQGVLADGRTVSYLLGDDGVVRIETPTDMKGTPITRNADGTWRVV